MGYIIIVGDDVDCMRYNIVSMSEKDQTGLQTCNFNTWLIIILRKKSLD